jgi:diaminopimelate epimerase
MQISFTKMHGAGNDMIMIDNRDAKINLDQATVAKLCDRHFGIGADGLILLENSDKADCFMNYYNSDGTIGEMCGNGIRCTAKFYLELNQETKKSITVDSRAGVKEIQITKTGYVVNMGKPNFQHSDFPTSEKTIENYNFHFASMGNPHAITIIQENPDNINLEQVGPVIENMKEFFANKINVEFVQILDQNNAVMRVWERGSGITLACGSGACAVFAIAHKLQLLESPAKIKLPGGPLIISYNQNQEILMEGPAETSYVGQIKI